MIKLVTLLTIVALAWASFVFRGAGQKTISGATLTPSPPIASTSLSAETLGLATDSAGLSNWKIYRDDKRKFEFRYPANVQLKRLGDGSLTLTDKSLAIIITHQTLSKTETVNTLAEKNINLDQAKLGEKFILLDNISPIAIGSQTGVTYTTSESGLEVTYFYIPFGDSYLLITNKTTEVPGEHLISLSDDIIFSLKLLDAGL